MVEKQETELKKNAHTARNRFNSLTVPNYGNMQSERIKLSIMTTRNNAVPSPLLSSKEAEDEINSGFSTSKGATMKPQLRGRFEANGRPPAFPSVLDRSYHQKSEMMSMTDQKQKDHEPIPKLQLTQPLQFQKTSRKNEYSTGRAGIGTNINSTAVSVDHTGTENSNPW